MRRGPRAEVLLRADKFRLRETRNITSPIIIRNFYRRKAKPCSWSCREFDHLQCSHLKSWLHPLLSNCRHYFAIGAGLEQKFESIEQQKQVAITFKMHILRADKLRLLETRNNYIAKHNSEFLPKKGEAMFLVLPRIQVLSPPMLASRTWLHQLLSNCPI